MKAHALKHLTSDRGPLTPRPIGREGYPQGEWISSGEKFSSHPQTHSKAPAVAPDGGKAQDLRPGQEDLDRREDPGGRVTTP